MWIDSIIYTSNNNTAVHTIPGGSVNGCDSTVTLNLTILHGTMGVDLQILCDSLVWIDGNTYYSNNNSATHVIPGGAANGCDSTVHLFLNLSYSATGTDTQTACESYTWIDGNTYYNSNNTATFTFQGGAASGCDSIVNLDLTILNNSIHVDSHEACNSFTWIDGNTYFTDNDTSTYIIPGAANNGCDSIILLDLQINSVDIGTVTNDPSINATATDATYQWLDCLNDFNPVPNEVNSLFTAQYNSEFAVEISQNNCVDTSDCIIISTVGLPDINVLETIKIFPNPTEGLINLELGDLSNVTINIFNFNNQLIYWEENIEGPKHQIIINCAPGLYYLTIDTQQQQQQVILVKE